MANLVALFTSIIKVFFTLLFFGLFIFVIYKGVFGKTKRHIYWIKYQLFKKKYPEKWVGICLQAINDDKTANELAMDYMSKGELNRRGAEELMYIYEQVKKSALGGLE